MDEEWTVLEKNRVKTPVENGQMIQVMNAKSHNDSHRSRRSIEKNGAIAVDKIL